MPIGLTLSGGGFRASLFHLGVIRRLAAEGRLTELRGIASVSGGSITAAHLLANWEKYNSSRESFDRAAEQLISLAKLDLRGRIQRRLPLLWLLALIPFMPRKWRLTPTHLLARYYDKYLFYGVCAADVEAPDRPELLILSTNLSLPGLTCFGSQRVLNITFDRAKVEEIPAQIIPLAQAVAASSAYPGFFPPISLNDSDLGADEGALTKQYFTDAGLFDNLGFYGLYKGTKYSLDRVYASDAGRSFVPQKEAEFGILRTALRAVDIFMFRIRQLDLAGLGSEQPINLISISHHTRAPGASTHAIQSQLESVRTDLDTFSCLEIDELIRHGYYVAADVLASEKGLSSPPRIPGWDIPAIADKPTQTDFARKLQSSAKRRWRLVSAHDWVSWAQISIVAILLISSFRLAGHISEEINRVMVGIQAYPLTRYSPPAWTDPPNADIELVDELTQPINDGFEILSDDRIWDLRQLHGDHSVGGTRVAGPTLMKRVSRLIRRNSAAQKYKYLFQTAATDFAVWSPLQGANVKVLRSKPHTVSGSNVALTSYELQFDVSGIALDKEFLLEVQARTNDAPWDRNNTWLGMRVTDRMPSASLRIIFPDTLPYKRPVFLKYPNDSTLPAQAIDGIVLDRNAEKELIWIIKEPQSGWTYRIQWDWD